MFITLHLTWSVYTTINKFHIPLLTDSLIFRKHSLWCIFPAGRVKGRSLDVLCSLCWPAPPVPHSAHSSLVERPHPSRPSSSYFDHCAQLKVTKRGRLIFLQWVRFTHKLPNYDLSTWMCKLVKLYKVMCQKTSDDFRFNSLECLTRHNATNCLIYDNREQDFFFFWFC